METLKNETLNIEYQRIRKLGEFDLDFYELQDQFKSLIEIAELIAGTEISVINLIDNYTQWTLSADGAEPKQIPKENSICSYTITSRDMLEVERLDLDDRFKNKPSVIGENGYRYYLGMPLTLSSGENVGVLCMMHRTEINIADDKKEALKVIAKEIVNKLELRRKLNETLFLLADTVRMKNQVAHDVRGPIHGISGLAESVEGEDLTVEEMLEFFKMIKESGKGIIDLTDEILSSGREQDMFKAREFELKDLKNRLLQLYELPARSKDIELKINSNTKKDAQAFSRKKLLSIFGNLISNAIKFTPSGGKIDVQLDIINSEKGKQLHVLVRDNGIGISQEAIDDYLDGTSEVSHGTTGEKGFGLGLKLVNEMVTDLDGTMNITSQNDKGTAIEIYIPI